MTITAERSATATIPAERPAPAPEPAAVPTLVRLALPDAVRDAVARELLALPDPALDPDLASTRCHQIFATLPTDLLQQLLDFGRHCDTAGVGLIENLPVDPVLPATPGDGLPSPDKPSHVAEGVLLGLSGLLGEAVGFTSEKQGRLIHDVVPVPAGSTTQTNQGSSVFLNFHNDIVYDPIGRYDLSNPDFLVLNCLRSDHDGQASTYYADARDVCRALDPQVLETLRCPLFRLNAPGSYVRNFAGGTDVLSDAVPLISGPAEAPEICASANGIHALTRAAQDALAQLQRACREVAHEVRLRPGQALLINNRKGLHARSAFTARYDGADRWLQRTYVRRSLWVIRYRATAADRRVHH
jgi:L-asparagine oxygenase